MKTKESFTPGPWKYQKPRGPQHAIDRKFEIVAPCSDRGEMVIVGEHTGIECLTEANARLIAASPALLSVAIELKKYAWANSPDSMPLDLRAVINAAADAIAQAEGHEAEGGR